MKKRKDPRGVTLFELLGYLALFGLLMNFVYGVYYQVSRTLSTADKGMLMERSTYDAVRSMQDDIRQSVSMLDSFGPFTSSDGCLILQGGSDSGDVIVYRLAESNRSLVRYHLAADQSGVSSKSVGMGVSGFKFSEDGEGLVAVTLVLNEKARGQALPCVMVFQAFMRNARNHA